MSAATDSSAGKPSASKRIKMGVEQDESLLLSMLDSDSLLSVLVRVPAEDHDSLRLTCKTIQAIVNSSQFKRERNRLEWVETKATVLTPREQHQLNVPIESDDREPHEREINILNDYNDLGCRDESYGYTDIKAKIWVDGKRAGSAKPHTRPPTALWSNFS